MFLRIAKISLSHIYENIDFIKFDISYVCQNVSNSLSIGVLNIIDSLNFLIFIFIFIKITLMQELRSYFEKSKKIENELIKNEPYIWYGKNVTGVIHNIKNKLTPIYLLLGEVVSDDGADKNIKKFAKLQIENSNNISNLLDQLLSIIKNKNTEEEKELNVNEIVLSVIEFFKANLEFKNNITINIENISKDLIIKTKPFELVQVIENIIKNSWDELRCKNGYKEIVMTINSENKSISIKDNGGGISHCNKCTNKNCFYNCNKFRIGNSSKENGLGYGMLFIENYIKSNGFKGVINSNKSGTEIIIYFI